jgi:SAM-dependent methyltransferase
LAAKLVERLHIHKTDKILDFGCAKGYLVKAFRLLGYSAYGIDISAYAIESAPPEVRPYLECTGSPIMSNMNHWDWIIAKDVLEHFDEKELKGILAELAGSTKHLFAVIPLGNGKKFNIPAYELDTTHQIKQSLEWWVHMFHGCGFTVSVAKYRMEGVKDNWVGHKEGNGFFVCHTGRKRK